MSHIKHLTSLFESNSNPTVSVGMAAYMKNNFPFLGIQTPTRNALEKQRLKSFSIESWSELKKLSIELWNKAEREYHYAAISLLIKYKKLWEEESIKHFERMILHNSWWDSVDSIDTKLVGEYFQLFSKNKNSIILSWAKSDNIWLQRTAIQFQLMYKTKTDTALLENIFEHTKSSKEFFVQKAMGRILREYSKTDAKWVRNYIKNTELPKLTVRE